MFAKNNQILLETNRRPSNSWKTHQFSSETNKFHRRPLHSLTNEKHSSRRPTHFRVGLTNSLLRKKLFCFWRPTDSRWKSNNSLPSQLILIGNQPSLGIDEIILIGDKPTLYSDLQILDRDILLPYRDKLLTDRGQLIFENDLLILAKVN